MNSFLLQILNFKQILLSPDDQIDKNKNPSESELRPERLKCPFTCQSELLREKENNFPF